MKDVLTKALVETVRKEMQASKVSQDSQHREEVKVRDYWMKKILFDFPRLHIL